MQTLTTRFQGLVKILKLMFRQDFEAVVIMKFNLGRDSEGRFGQDFGGLKLVSCMHVWRHNGNITWGLCPNYFIVDHHQK